MNSGDIVGKSVVLCDTSSVSVEGNIGRTLECRLKVLYLRLEWDNDRIFLSTGKLFVVLEKARSVNVFTRSMQDRAVFFLITHIF